MNDPLAKERKDGQLAQQVKDNPIYQDAFITVQEHLRRWMEDPKTSDEQTLEAKRLLAVSNRFRQALETVMDTGKLAERQILDRDKEKKRHIFGI